MTAGFPDRNFGKKFRIKRPIDSQKTRRIAKPTGASVDIPEDALQQEGRPWEPQSGKPSAKGAGHVVRGAAPQPPPPTRAALRQVSVRGASSDLQQKARGRASKQLPHG